MATINGRRVKLLKEDGQPIGIARGWKPESDWMKVVTDDGVTYMVHCTDPIEILRLPPILTEIDIARLCGGRFR
jgi:hypothetical protein